MGGPSTDMSAKMPAAWLTLVSLLLAMADRGGIQSDPEDNPLIDFLSRPHVEGRKPGFGKSGRDEPAGRQHGKVSHRVNQGVLTRENAKQVRRRDGEEEGEEEKGRLGPN